MIKILELPKDADLSELSRELWVRKIGHQIRRTDLCQELFLADPEHYPQVMHLAQEWQQGTLAYTVDVDSASAPAYATRAGWSLKQAAQWPLTVIVLLISVLLTALISFESQPEWLARLTIVPFRQVMQGLAYMPLADTLQAGEFWRLITPTFLHFGALHLIFNSLWVWELGRMIEQKQSGLTFAVLFLLTGISANLAQYLMGDILFGGLSGVVYALLGYCWFWDRLAQQPLFYIRKPVFIFLLVWMLFCLVGGASLLGFGEVANAAHVAGLVSGSLWAVVRVRVLGAGKPAV